MLTQVQPLSALVWRISLLVIFVAPIAIAADPPALIQIMERELVRNFTVLKEKPDPSAYFLAYSITENETTSLEATSGLLGAKDSRRIRALDVTLRLGTPKLDNYHRMPGQPVHFTMGSTISLDDNPNAIRRRLWLDTDGVYRAASQRLTNLRTNTQVKVDANDPSDDFSPAPPVISFRDVPTYKVNEKQWADRLRQWSAKLSQFPEILNSSVSFYAQREVKYFVNSEGTKLRHGRTYARIVIGARSKAYDGMDLSTSATLEADEPSGLPDSKQVEAAIDKVASDLRVLLKSNEVDPFVGPAILSGSAAGVLFHEIFGHRIEGHRQKDEGEGQTFTKRVGMPVLPEFLSVSFDPTSKRVGKQDLFGWYDFDDEGVAARRVNVVDSGILRTFLMSRSPIAGFQDSNGHGRKQPGNEVVSRQSNLMVHSTRTMPESNLRQALVEEIKKQGKPHGLYFEAVTGGFTTTGRSGLQAFSVIPLVVYKVYPDGRPDEMVRGVDIVGTPLASFAKIIATSNVPQVFNGYCGAESGSVPVSASSPALLLSEIEVQKKNRSQDRPPLLPRPSSLAPAGAGI